MLTNILIVGGSGNLGIHICNYLEKIKNISLINIDKKQKKNSNRIRFINCDLLKVINKKKLPKNIDVIIFSAGFIGGNKSIKKKFIEKYFKLNIYSLSNLLEKIDKLKLKKIIFFSSEQVYGDNQINMDKKKAKFFEPMPKNYYGASKLIAEKYLNYFYHYYDKKFSIDILRIPRIIDLSNNSLLYYLMKKCSQNENIHITNIKEKFNFIFIDDFLNVLTNSINQKKKLFRILDLGSKDRKSFSIINIVKMINNKLNKKNKFFFKNIENTHNPLSLKINKDYSYKSLGYKPKVSVKKMLELIRVKYEL